MTTSDYQPPQFVTPHSVSEYGAVGDPPAAPTPPLVTFAAERRLRHAATLFIVVTYIYLGLMALFLLLALAGMSGSL
jgi:hypothetical protein